MGVALRAVAKERALFAQGPGDVPGQLHFVRDVLTRPQNSPAVRASARL